ncbi:hypothetical protein Tco_1524208 [Tanacetum coccineum]
MKFTNYILVAEVIILDSIGLTTTEPLKRSSFYDIPPSTHPINISSDNAFDSSYKTVEADVGLTTVSLTDVVEAKTPPPVRN